MNDTQTTARRYVICKENNGYGASLTQGQVYEVLPDLAEVNEMIRVVDDSGEDYLFEASLFEPVGNLTDPDN